MIERVSQNIQSFYRLRSYNLHKFKPKIQIHKDLGPFVIKTSNSIEELKESFALRFEVFHKEMTGTTSPWGLDIDQFDFDGDHLIIKEKRTDKIVGTYRVRSSEFSNNFYSTKKFMMTSILQQPGVKLELGRACIHSAYRQGVVMSLLWKGIAEYVAASDANFIFSCTTVQSDDPRDAALLTQYFEEVGRINPGFRARPTFAYTMPLLGFFKEELRSPLTETQRAAARELLPELGLAHIDMGAYIGGEPAWNQDLHSIDFLTILHRHELNKRLWKNIEAIES